MMNCPKIFKKILWRINFFNFLHLYFPSMWLYIYFHSIHVQMFSCLKYLVENKKRTSTSLFDIYKKMNKSYKEEVVKLRKKKRKKNLEAIKNHKTLKKGNCYCIKLDNIFR